MAGKKSWRQRLSTWVGGGLPATEDVTLTEAPSGGGGVKRNPSETLVKKVGLAMDVGSSREYQAPDFDLAAISNAYDSESYVRQAFDKYIESMFKAGWDLVGKNQNAVDYLRLRLKLMAEMTEIPTDQLFIEIAEDLVKYSNVIVLKARDKQGLLGGANTGVNVQGIGDQEPVAGYFPINVTTISVLRDKNGAIKGWQQEVEGEDKPVKFKSTDVVHFYYKREKGRAFGTPFLLSALDDIRALRQLEETVLRLTYRSLHPLLHVQVGSEGLPGQPGEVEIVRDEFENMDLEAALVTSERVKVDSVKSDVIDANNYMKYFEQRVFTGLGVSEMMMGRGATASRSTGDNLSSEFLDRVKAFQKVMAIFVDEFMIQELLMEGGFDPVLNPDDDVDFVFKEIDVDAKIKAENHAIYQYEHNAITESEMRSLIGRDPITDRAEMFMNLVTIPTATAKSANTEETGTAATDNKNKPTNQHGTKPSPKAKESDTALRQRYTESLDRVYESAQQRIMESVGDYLKTEDGVILTRLAEDIREVEQDLFTTFERYLGIDYAKPFTIHLNRLCQQLHHEVIETVTGMKGEQKEARVFETLGGVHEVHSMRLQDIADKAYANYLKNPFDETQEEVEQ